MKTFTTIIALICLQLSAFCQSAISDATTENTAACATLVYSETNKELMTADASPLKCREVTISNLPPVTHSATVLNIDFGMTGSFTFIKNETMQIYEDRDVYIEDMLTGKVFDLKTSTSYTFSVNRRIPNRFVLHIDNMLTRYDISSR
jgi:hypothetical protein